MPILSGYFRWGFLIKINMKKLIKRDIGFYQNIIDNDLSIIPIKEIEGGHKPNLQSWSKYQKEVVFTIDLDNWHNDPQTTSFGLVTGYNDVEAIDIDSKILPTKKDRDGFLNEYFNLLDNHIDDFYKKVCVVRTQSGGFHILYKSKSIVGAKKIAKPKGHKEALIESRGTGGFVYIYERVKGLQYHEIDYISEEDRELLWQISKTYDHEEPKLEIKTTKTTPSNRDGKSAWEDYAEKNNILSICGDEFDIVRKGKSSTMIKRKGAESAFSGHIYDNSGKMFLFSTGTIYPHEKPLNSFDIYTYKYHQGDYSASAKQAYADGYGDRIEREIHIEPTEEIEIEEDGFPLDIFPDFFAHYIRQCNKKLNASVDFMGVATLWMISTLIGNTFNVKVKNGWIDRAIIWISVIGNAGVGKTPDLKLVLKPLMKLNSQEIKRYIKEYGEYKEYDEMSKEDKDVNATVEKPFKKQLIVDDITMESLIDIHTNNPKSIGVFKDELAGWFKDMNKYRDGSDKERYLSAWSGDSIILNRKTTEDAYVEHPFIPILGGIQPSIFKEFQTEENQSNGFMDRMLFCNPNKIAQYPTDEELDEELIGDYRDLIFRIKDNVDTHFTEEVDGVIIPKVLELTKEAKALYKKQHCELIDLMNSDNEVHYYQGMYAKQITYIPRFALIIEFLNAIVDDVAPTEISVESIEKAGRLSKYFVNMAKVNKSENIKQGKMQDVIIKMKGKPNADIAKKIVELFPETPKKKIAESMEVSVRMIYKYLK